MNATSSTLKLIYANKLNTDYFNYLIVVGKENNNYYNRPLNYFESMARTTGLFLDFFDPTTENISKLEELCNSARLIIIDDRSFGENSLAHKIKAGKIKSPELCRTPSILIPRTIKSLRIKFYFPSRTHAIMRLPAPLSRRKSNAHKNDFGHVLVIAGSANMLGAAALTSLAAMRAGAGLVTVAVPKTLDPVLQKKISPVRSPAIYKFMTKILLKLSFLK